MKKIIIPIVMLSILVFSVFAILDAFSVRSTDRDVKFSAWSNHGKGYGHWKYRTDDSIVRAKLIEVDRVGENIVYEAKYTVRNLDTREVTRYTEMLDASYDGGDVFYIASDTINVKRLR